MNNINDFIKKLSIKDKKTLSQKGLKLIEEIKTTAENRDEKLNEIL